MIRLLLDMGLPRRTAEDLRTQGIDVEHVAQRGLATAADETIIALAVEERRIVVTEDHDFARAIKRPRCSRESSMSRGGTWKSERSSR